jgi:hypothetical protein
MKRMTIAGALALFLGTACDPRVQPASGETSAAVPGVAPSAEGETCATTSHCANGLHCVEAVCRPLKSSRLGDYYQASGHAAVGRGDGAAASEAFGKAIGAYESANLPPPASLLCDAGMALRRKKGDAKAAEQAARLLHRCVLAAVPGTVDYRLALDELAALEPEGLEASLLAKDAPGDMYLTRPSARPVGEPKVEIAPGATPSRDKGYAAFITRAGAAPGVRNGLVDCWKAYSAAAQKPLLSVIVELKYRQVLGDDDIVEGAKLELGGTPPAGAEGAAHACVKAALAPVADEIAKDRSSSSGNWQGNVVVMVQAP